MCDDMTTDLYLEHRHPVEDLHLVLQRHGLLKTLLALPFAAMKPYRPVYLRTGDLPDYLMRDVGLDRDRMPKQLWERR